MFISKVCNRKDVYTSLKPFSKRLFPTENTITPGLMTDNKEILDFEDITFTSSGLVLTPSSKQHIYKSHFTHGDFKFHSSVVVIDLIDDIMKSVHLGDQKAHVFCDFKDYDNFFNKMDKVKVVYESQKEIGKDGSKFAILVIDPSDNHILTISPCSKNKYASGQRISKLFPIIVSQNINKTFSLGHPVKKSKIVSKSGLIFDNYQLCAASRYVNRKTTKKNTIRVDNLEFAYNINIMDLSEEIMNKFENGSQNLTSNYTYKELDNFFIDDIVIGYKRGNNLPQISATEGRYAKLMFSPNMRVMEFRPCTQIEFEQIKNMK